MKDEIDSEEALFDDSTNPSLTHDAPVAKPNPKKRRKTQRAEVIPEEEQASGIA